MERMNGIAKLICSVALLLFAVAALIFSLRSTSNEANAVGVASRRAGYNGFVFTQSPSGKVLYKWEWDSKKNSWVRTRHAGR
ncbi:MAG: hypothetical protein EP343_24755 [Deltaproteobacteria bacterium]|nr:MAG: hypothetical protein EP343_24755 [Deltaproteobacteria bacterium]